MLSSVQAERARRERAGATVGSAQYRKANREFGTATAGAVTSAGGVAASTFSAAGQIVGAGSQLMGDAASVTAGALGAVASFLALPFQVFSTGRTIRKAAKQYARVSALQKAVTDPNIDAAKAKKAWQSKQELVDGLDAQKQELQADLADVIAEDSALVRSMNPKNVRRMGAKFTALATERAQIEDAIKQLDASITAERTELARLDQAKQDAEKAIRDAADRAKGPNPQETPEDIAIYAMRKNQAGFTKKILVDGEEREELAAGDERTIAVDPGRRTVRLKFLYISSEPRELELAEGEDVRFEAKRAFGSGPFDIRYFTQRKKAIAVEVCEP